eukprot:6656605-Prymnesium_polylepis.1
MGKAKVPKVAKPKIPYHLCRKLTQSKEALLEACGGDEDKAEKLFSEKPRLGRPPNKQNECKGRKKKGKNSLSVLKLRKKRAQKRHATQHAARE